MVTYGPVFCDITWGAGGSTADVTLDIATRMQNMVRLSSRDRHAYGWGSKMRTPHTSASGGVAAVFLPHFQASCCTAVAESPRPCRELVLNLTLAMTHMG